MAIYESEFQGATIDARLAAVATMQTAISNLETAVAAKYSKPSSGIPETDLDASVQAALALARTAVQSLSDYYTKAQVDDITAAIAASVNSTIGEVVTILPTAGAGTLGKMYYVGPDANGFYDRYVTTYDGSTYSWLALGSSEIDMTQYATKDDLAQLEQELVVGETIAVPLTATRNLRPNSAGVRTGDNGYSYIATVKNGEVFTVDFTVPSGYYLRYGFTVQYPAGGVAVSGYGDKNATQHQVVLTAPSDGYLLLECGQPFTELAVTKPAGDTIGHTVYEDHKQVEKLSGDMYEPVTVNGIKEAGVAYTLAVNSAPSAVSSGSYNAMIADNLKEGDVITINARAGSSYATWAKIKNNVVIWASDTGLAVDTTIVCDGTFDKIITNSYSSYVPSPTLTVATTKSLRDTLKRQIRILAIGNSFTEDAFAYMPDILKKICPDLDITIAIGYIGGSPLAQHLAYFTGQDVTQETTLYRTANGLYQRVNANTMAVEWEGLYKVTTSVNGGAWDNGEDMTVQQMLDKEQWDIITFQQSGGRSNSDWDTYYAPYIYALQKSLFSKIDYPTRLGWVLVHGAYGNSDASFLSKWEGTAVNAEKVMDKTGVSILFPYGTAVQNLRTTTLKSLGDGEHHNLTVDDAHLQEGIGPLAAAYTNAIVIMRALGFPYGVVGDDTRPDAAWITSINAPGPNIGTGVIGITDANCFLAQVAAEKAVMNPYELTDLSVFQS